MTSQEDIERILELLEKEETTRIQVILASLRAFTGWLKNVSARLYLKLQHTIDQIFGWIRNVFGLSGRLPGNPTTDAPPPKKKKK